MLLLAITLWFVSTIPVGINVGRRLALQRSLKISQNVPIPAIKRRVVSEEIGKSA